MTQHTIRRRWTSMLALGMIAALAMPGTAQATPQLGDLGVKQSMSVKASNGESLEGKDLRASSLPHIPPQAWTATRSSATI